MNILHSKHAIINVRQNLLLESIRKLPYNTEINLLVLARGKKDKISFKKSDKAFPTQTSSVQGVGLMKGWPVELSVNISDSLITKSFNPITQRLILM